MSLDVSATPFDLNSGSFFPPAGPGTPYNPSNNGYDDVFGEASMWNPSNGAGEMWYLPPGQAFYAHLNDQGVTQTAEGVNVGGMDLLDFMALDNFTGVESGGGGGF
jgi:hypothetical protein